MQFYYARRPSFGVASESLGMYGTPWSRRNKLQEAREQENCRKPQVMVCGREFCPRWKRSRSPCPPSLPRRLHSGHYTSGLRIGWQRHVARLCFGDLCHLARRLVREQVCALLGVARLALLLRFDGSPVSVRRHRRLELAARLCCHWIERDWRLLSLRKSIVARCDGPRRLRCPSGNFSYGNIRLDCLA